MIRISHVMPHSGVLAAMGQFWGISRAELIMQWRRWGFWLTFGIVAALLMLISAVNAFSLLHPSPMMEQIYKHYTTKELNNVMTYGLTCYGTIIFGLVIALLIVDRQRRDQQVGMDELQHATPLGQAPYIFGKFLGNYIAVFVPTLLVYLLCALVPIVLGMSVIVLPLFLLAFLLIFIPASLASVGLILMLASILPVRVVQVGFSALWLLFNIPVWHTFYMTIFNPNGYYIYPVFFSSPLFSTIDTSLSKALLNITVLVLTGIVSLCLTALILTWQQRRMENA